MIEKIMKIYSEHTVGVVSLVSTIYVLKWIFEYLIDGLVMIIEVIKEIVVFFAAYHILKYQYPLINDAVVFLVIMVVYFIVLFIELLIDRTEGLYFITEIIKIIVISIFVISKYNAFFIAF